MTTIVFCILPAQCISMHISGKRLSVSLGLCAVILNVMFVLLVILRVCVHLHCDIVFPVQDAALQLST